jgi:biotin synthase
MTRDEIVDCARLAVALGYGTVVMQAGEDSALSAEWIADIVRWIKSETPLAVTLSLGERSQDELRLWREGGADRYLLRFETSDPDLYRAIHPSRNLEEPNRIALLRILKMLGYEGSGRYDIQRSRSGYDRDRAVYSASGNAIGIREATSKHCSGRTSPG